VIKKILRLAAALLLRVGIVVGLVFVAIDAYFATDTADEMKSRLIAAGVVIVCAIVYYLSIRVAGRRLRPVLDSVIVLGMLGVVVFCVSSIVEATSRSMVKRTMADMRSIGTAVEAYSTDFNTYPQASNMDELAKLLEPVYIKEMPRKDGWRYPFRYEVVGKGKDSSYYIGSSGRGGAWQKAHLAEYTKHQNQSTSDDIVWHNGEFIASLMPE